MYVVDQRFYKVLEVISRDVCGRIGENLWGGGVPTEMESVWAVLFQGGGKTIVLIPFTSVPLWEFKYFGVIIRCFRVGVGQ